MEAFHWDNNFVTKLPTVDDQHHHLIDLINEFGGLLTENEIAIEDVSRLFGKLSDYAVYHFDREEELMSEVKLDKRHVEKHKKMHKGFLDDVSSIYFRISSDNLDQADSLLKFLTHWLAFHILGQDQDMAKQIRAIRSGTDPRHAYEQLEQERTSATAPLLEALNGLFEHVSQQNKQLTELNESLEKKVSLRTKELSDTNLQLKALSMTDLLTGLPNRRHALQRLSNLWQDASQKNHPLTCFMIDADHFKEVNDTYGHDAGDSVLIKLAKTLQHSLRNDDIVCRLGGDEFFVICPNTDREGGMYIAELTRKVVSELRVHTGGEPWHGSVSIRVASRSPDMESCDELIKAADKCLYAAKEAGKNCVR